DNVVFQKSESTPVYQLRCFFVTKSKLNCPITTNLKRINRIGFYRFEKFVTKYKYAKKQYLIIINFIEFDENVR
ncbi:hypothetical protein, partial [Bacillus sp. AFS029533]|uniref:hypothetical protein n=1 Tax=Bacillus sp. AFS029533 TaxID=2033494 RepID=UPI000C02DB6C